jgi:hypothetical protein
MQLDAVLSKPSLSMREIEEAHTGNFHLDVALDNVKLRDGWFFRELRGKVLASFLYLAQLGGGTDSATVWVGYLDDHRLAEVLEVCDDDVKVAVSLMLVPYQSRSDLERLPFHLLGCARPERFMGEVEALTPRNSEEPGRNRGTRRSGAAPL